MSEVSLLPWWATVFIVVWGAVSALVGTIVGHYLSRSSERRQWVLNHRLEEWKELIGTLHDSFATMALGKGDVTDPPTVEGLKRYFGAETNAMSVINNRIFIFQDVEDEEVAGKWAALTNEWERTKDGVNAGKTFGVMLKRLKTMASSDARK